MVGSAFLSWFTRGASGVRPAPRREHLPRAAGRCLVIAPALGYGPRDVKAFLASLRACHDGPVAILTDQPTLLGPLLERFQADCLQPSASPGYVPHPVTARFAESLMALDLYPEADTVLLSDVRDVLFQANPFDPMPRRLQFFVESEPMTLAQHGSNLRWLQAIVGAELAGTVADRPCVCAGTILGPRAGIVRMIRQMMLVLSIPRKAVPAGFGADQATLNLLAHLDLIGEADIIPNRRHVLTLGKTNLDAVSLDARGVIRNADGSASAIVHQYDRHAAINAAITERYGVMAEAALQLRRKRPPRLVRSLLKRIPELR